MTEKVTIRTMARNLMAFNMDEKYFEIAKERMHYGCDEK